MHRTRADHDFEPGQAELASRAARPTPDLRPPNFLRVIPGQQGLRRETSAFACSRRHGPAPLVHDRGRFHGRRQSDIATVSEYDSVVNSPAVFLSAGRAHFRNVGTSSAQVLTINNSGPGSLRLGTIRIAGKNAADFSKTSTCGNSLAPAAQCTVSVTFTPTATGPRNGVLAISDNAQEARRLLTFPLCAMAHCVNFSLK